MTTPQTPVDSLMALVSEYAKRTNAPLTSDSVQRAVETWNAIEASARALAAIPAQVERADFLAEQVQLLNKLWNESDLVSPNIADQLHLCVCIAFAMLAAAPTPPTAPTQADREAAQRERMKALFENRPKRPASADFDLIAQSDVPAQDVPWVESIRRLVADDSYAMSFQTMGQYRTALLKALAALRASSPADRPVPKFDHAALYRAMHLASMLAGSVGMSNVAESRGHSNDLRAHLSQFIVTKEST